MVESAECSQCKRESGHFQSFADWPISYSTKYGEIKVQTLLLDFELNYAITYPTSIIYQVYVDIAGTFKKMCILLRVGDAMEWRTVVIIVLVVSLCFFIIPIKVKPDKNVEDTKLFANYVVQYNKFYRNDSTEYKKRFECFQVITISRFVKIVVAKTQTRRTSFKQLRIYFLRI